VVDCLDYSNNVDVDDLKGFADHVAVAVEISYVAADYGVVVVVVADFA